jgi:hypothetical protein
MKFAIGRIRKVLRGWEMTAAGVALVGGHSPTKVTWSDHGIRDEKDNYTGLNLQYASMHAILPEEQCNSLSSDTKSAHRS